MGVKGGGLGMAPSWHCKVTAAACGVGCNSFILQQTYLSTLPSGLPRQAY